MRRLKGTTRPDTGTYPTTFAQTVNLAHSFNVPNQNVYTRYIMTPVFLILMVISPLALGSSEPQMEAALFGYADRDGDGELNQADLKVVFDRFDTNTDGSVTEAEFVTDWSQVYSLGNADEARTLFSKADSNADGVLNNADLSAIFAYFDMNGNNMVDLNEFLTQWGDLRLTAPDTVNVVG